MRSMKPLSPRFRKWLIVPPVVLGVGIIVFFILTADGPERREAREEARVLRVIHAPEVDVVPRILGYGEARPSRIWRAIAEVKGRVISTHPDLSSGAILTEGAEILRIDATEYELAHTEIEANKAQVAAQIRELEAQQVSYEASLKIERAALELAESSFQRSRELLESGTSSQSEVEQAERDALAQRTSVQTIENSLRLIPAQLQTLQANQKVYDANLAQAKLEIEKTVLVAPFACRLAEVDVEPGQFLSVGEVVLEAHDIASAEVEAKMSMDRLRNLIEPGQRGQVRLGLPMEQLRKIFDVTAEVQVEIGETDIRWPARFQLVRELIDPKTRTIGVVVTVDEPYTGSIPGERPPLVNGTFCAVEMRGKVRKQRIVIPRAAYRDGAVFVVGPDSRLTRRPVEIDFAQSDFFCVLSGIEKGEAIVVSDPTPAIVTDEATGQQGLLVQPELAADVARDLTAQARGEVDLR